MASGAKEPERSAREASSGGGSTILASALVAAIVGVAVSYVFFNLRMRPASSGASSDIAALTTRLIEVERNVETTGDQLTALQAKVAQTSELTVAMIGPDARVAHLVALPIAPSAAGNVAINRTEGTAMLEVSGLPPTPDEKEYDVWWIGERNSATKAGSFEPLSEGATIVSLDLPSSGVVVVGSVITLEARGNVDKPGGATYLKGDFPRR
ncbi:MAG TPA: anti-sigma factor [Candidatus Binatus sp.]|nr:anti-sigma factor [Candidatus Binatus sp.]